MVDRRWRSLLLAAAIVTLLAVACEAAPTSPLPTATAAPGSTLSPTPPVTAALGSTLSPTPRPALGSNFTGGPPIPESSLTTLEADPDWREALAGLGIDRRIWKTDFRFHTVPYSDIFSGGVPRDGIAPLDEPKFITLQEAADWLAPLEPVVALEINGDSRAYPLQVLTWHEIVNDEVGGVPVAVTFCPLCNSAIAFERTLDGLVYDFGTTGKLRNSDLVMWDRQTQSWWQQLTGEAIVGVLSGNRLGFLPASITSWQDFQAGNPDGKVLSSDTGYSRNYGVNPYAGYDRADLPPFLFRGDLDGRLLPKERVAAITVAGTDIAFPFSVLADQRVVNYHVNGVDLAVFFEPETQSALDTPSFADARQVGAAAVFRPELDGEMLTFRFKDERIEDVGTGSGWNILGVAVDGPLKGERLAKFVHGDHFWFAWAAFKPDSIIYSGSDGAE